MTSLSLVLSASLERGLRESSVTFACAVLGELSTAGALNCSLEHALSLFDFDGLKLTTKRSVAAKLKRAKELSGKTKKAKLSRTSKPTMILPFCGEIVTDWCHGVRLNHGLHTQCTNARVAEGEYCKTCTKAASNSATDKPPYGDIRDRASSGVNYRDPKGRQTLPYANVAEKLKLDISKAHVAATAFGWTIPAEQLVKRSVKRGRPGKSAAVSDTDSVNSSKSTKKLKKKLKVKKTQSDLIAKLVAEAGEQLLGEDSDSSCHFCKSDHESSDCPSLAEATKLAEDAAEKDAVEKKAAKLAEKERLKEEKLVQKLKKQLAALFNLEELDADLASTAAGKDSAALKKLIAEEKTGLKEAAKVAALAAKEAAKVAKLAEKEAAKVAKLAEKEAAKAAKLVEKEAAKQEKEAAKQEKEAAKAAKLAEKEAAKQAKLDAKAAKVAAKASKEAEKVKKLLKQLTKLDSGSPLLGVDASSKALRAEIKKVKASQQVAAAAALSSAELEEESLESETSDGAAAAEADDDECDVVEKTIGGVTYLYDEAGNYADVPHLLLTPEGAPIGVYDAEHDQVELKDFKFEGADE